MEQIDLMVNEYQVAGGGPFEADDITLRRMPQRRGADKWAIYNRSAVLSRDGDWEYEPLPSSRTDAYLARCRFNSAQEALAFYRSVAAQDSDGESPVVGDGGQDGDK